MRGIISTHRKIFNNNCGMALVVTIAVISTLFMMALHLARITGESVLSSGTATDEFVAQEMALSGIHLAMAILADDASKNKIDSVQEDWNNPEKILLAVDQLGFAKDSLSLKITDELGKIQVNALLKKFPGNEMNIDQKVIWERFLNLRISADKSEDQRDPTNIINALKDWLDSLDDDDSTGTSDAESDYYLGLDPPYVCNNGPFNHIDELLNVKGITADLLKPDTAESDTAESDLTTSHRDNSIDPEPEKELGFEDLFTVYGLDDAASSGKSYAFSGKININTAPVDVLAALLPSGMEELAGNMVEFREEKPEKDTVFINLLSKGWYERVIKLSEKQKKTFDSMIRYDSNLFKVKCTAQKRDTKVIVSAFLKRERDKETNQWMCRIIQLLKE
ncbi:MAG: general secretion pathway protein GspK [Desulfobacteraceae bacterium]|nr:general secretion pathway protein GspK [Desulfobacteraceae bacterium]